MISSFSRACWWACAAWSTLSCLGCAEVAGLDQFYPAGVGGADGEGGEGATGGAPAGGGGQGGGTTTCAEHLLITEFRAYGTGQGDDDFVELYNPTKNPIDLLDVSVAARPPGSTNIERWRGGSGDVLEPGGFFLIAGMGFDDGPEPDIELPVTKSFGNETIVGLFDAVGKPLDALCVCTENCGSPDFDTCRSVVLVNPAWDADTGEFVPTDESLQRVPQCNDQDVPENFTTAPSTPKQDNE